MTAPKIYTESDFSEKLEEILCELKTQCTLAANLKIQPESFALRNLHEVAEFVKSEGVNRPVHTVVNSPDGYCAQSVHMGIHMGRLSIPNSNDVYPVDDEGNFYTFVLTNKNDELAGVGFLGAKDSSIITIYRDMVGEVI